MIYFKFRNSFYLFICSIMFLGIFSCLIDGDYLELLPPCIFIFFLLFLYKDKMTLKTKGDDGITINFSFYHTKIRYRQIECIENVEDFTESSYYRWGVRCFHIKTAKNKYYVHYDKNESDDVKRIFEVVGSACP